MSELNFFDWIGPGKRYATVEDMALDAMRWHDEAQAEKMHSMKVEEDLEKRADLERRTVEALALMEKASDVSCRAMAASLLAYFKELRGE